MKVALLGGNNICKFPHIHYMCYCGCMASLSIGPKPINITNLIGTLELSRWITVDLPNHEVLELANHKFCDVY